jgi:CBS domain containing-hemolysin-like protein
MVTFVLIIGLSLATIISITLMKAYTHVPAKELKRRARAGDVTANALYKAAAYGHSLRALLWFFIGLFAASFFVLLVHSTSSWVAVLGSAALLWFGFAWLPNSEVSSFGNVLAKLFTPPLVWLVRQLQPMLSGPVLFIHNHRHIRIHTGIYEKADLVELLKQQKKQADNRISKEELTIASNALQFGDKLVRDVMVPRRMAKTVAAGDTIGPLLMDELHKSGHSRFPVYQDKKDNIVGILHARDLMDANGGGRVSSVMKKGVYYVKEDKPLGHVLDAFLKTKNHLFIVVNNFEEVAGIITIEDILEQILGKPILDEFDTYENLRAVATHDAQKEEEKHTEEGKVVE